MFVLSKLPPRWRFRIMSMLRGGAEAARALGVTVGSDCRIYSCSVSSEYELLSIGNHVTVSTEVLFITHDGTGWLVDDGGKRRYRLAPITIGDNSFIGARSTILPGVQIGADCIVAAGSVVTKSVPSGTIVGGNPASPIGEFYEFSRRVSTNWSTDRTVDAQFKPLMKIRSRANFSALSSDKES